MENQNLDPKNPHINFESEDGGITAYVPICERQGYPNSSSDIIRNILEKSGVDYSLRLAKKS